MITELAPMVTGSVVRPPGVGLVVTSDKPSSAHSFVLLICALLGGHPRCVARFLEKLKKQVAELVDERCPPSQKTTILDDVQRVCWASLDDALTTYSVSAMRGSDGSGNLMNNVR